MKKLQTNQRHGGYNLFEAMVVTGVMAVLIALYLPNLLRPRGCRCQRINCTNNLKQIGLSYLQWSLDNDDKFPMQVSVTNGGAMELVARGNICLNFQVMSNELNTPKILICPEDNAPGRIAATMFWSKSPAGPVGQIPFSTNNVSYFVGADADESMPQMLLSGDDNLALARLKLPPGLLQLSTNSPVGWTSRRHKNQGNILLVDGSVQSLGSVQLRAALGSTGVATNRLLMP